ncbi:hypothetical protein [Actinoplanes sp. HUAS TT8]
MRTNEQLSTGSSKAAQRLKVVGMRIGWTGGPPPADRNRPSSRLGHG